MQVFNEAVSGKKHGDHIVMWTWAEGQTLIAILQDACSREKRKRSWANLLRRMEVNHGCGRFCICSREARTLVDMALSACAANQKRKLWAQVLDALVSKLDCY